MIDARDRLIVALDVPDLRTAESLVERLGDGVTFYKIGYQLLFDRGLPFAEALVRSGKRVFLDLKLHDIGNTVANGVAGAARMGVTFLTVHGYPQTMQAALEGRRGSDLRILAVTVLTSYADADLAAAGYGVSVADLVTRRAREAQEIGIDGLVCSGQEVTHLRQFVGNEMTLVVPGIRPAGTAGGDQKRVMTPADAVAAGADYLVVGRPIVEAADPVAAAAAIVAEMGAV